MGEFGKIARKRKLTDFSWGLAARMTDLSLIGLFLGLSLSLPSKHTSKFLSQIFGKIQGPIDETKIKNSFYQLKRQGLIVYGLRLWQTPQITQAGKEKLKRLLPHYNNKRIWDKRLYLVSYDIPNSKKAVRDNLRQILKTLGCGLLQESVWLTPYNPKEVLKNFVAENNLSGLVLLSDLGLDGNIGEEDNRGLVGRVYRLEELNQRYGEFLDQWKNKPPQPESLPQFFSILKDDPQLPFALLPNDWLGEKAWELISPLNNFVSR